MKFEIKIPSIISKKMNKNDFKKSFFNSPFHAWIQSDKQFKRCFELLIDSFGPEEIKFFTDNPILFLQSNAVLSCTLGKDSENIILVFPDLAKLMTSSCYFQAIATLAHECGHVFYRHTEVEMENLEKQIQADFFAYKLGYGEDLQDILLEHNHSIETKVRIAKLTALLISDKYPNTNH